MRRTVKHIDWWLRRSESNEWPLAEPLRWTVAPASDPAWCRPSAPPMGEEWTKYAPGEPTEIWVSKLKNKEQMGVKRVMAVPKHGCKQMKVTGTDPLPLEHPVEMPLAAAGSTEAVVLPDVVDDASRPDRLVLGCSTCRGAPSRLPRVS